MKNFRLACILPSLVFSVSALHAEPILKPQTQGGVNFVSGGIGSEERTELKAMRSNYNLSLLFSKRGGEYLSDVKVRITDANSRAVLETVATGPQLFVKLPSGPYSVNAEFDGKRFDKKVSVSDKQQPAVSFVWP